MEVYQFVRASFPFGFQWGWDFLVLVPDQSLTTVKILKIGTPEIITIIVLQLEQLDFTVQYCVQKMQTELQTEKTLIRLLREEQSDLGLHCLLRPICPNI